MTQEIHVERDIFTVRNVYDYLLIVDILFEVFYVTLSVLI